MNGIEPLAIVAKLFGDQVLGQKGSTWHLILFCLTCRRYLGPSTPSSCHPEAGSHHQGHRDASLVATLIEDVFWNLTVSAQGWMAALFD